MKLLRYLLFTFCWLAALMAANAQNESLKVGVVPSPPFTMQQDGIWAGHTIELWEKITEVNKWSFHYVAYPSVEAALAAVTKGDCDVVVGDTSITSQRMTQMDFSQPFFRSGLQIMVVQDRPHTFGRLFGEIFELGHLRILWIAAGVVVIFTLVVTIFERRHNPDFPKAWHDGIAEAFYNVISLTLTGKSVYKGFPGVLGRLVMVVWMLLGLFVVAFVTSSITTTMTIEQLQGHINGPQDLPGKTVAVLSGTTGVDYARNHGIQYLAYDSMDAAVNALTRQEVAAIVSDAPILQYYDYQHPKLPITEVGPIFDPHNFGFALPKDSPLRLPMNEALLSILESGYLQQLGKCYFGDAFQL